MSITSEAIIRWLQRVAQILHEKREYLTQLDAAIGDADHGINMDRGFKAVIEKLPSLANADIGAILKMVGTTLVSTVGGASGPLYGTAFLRAGIVTTGKSELRENDVVEMLAAMVEGIQVRGKAQAGEKTMLDAFLPALDVARQADLDEVEMAQLLNVCCQAAEEGAQRTLSLLATKGRASYLGERSVGHLDPGAISASYILAALAEAYG
ncbi:dihydroxyacetone kinase subunit DhaL [Ktedonospora formicarum]|uniref:Dihydroxyacetone kinase subunit L n=1 Tax=Ktedonospora formicarum TaxID=2778364 RepID=A0A8J3MYW3_9CHLR|nr:dihydroxyacetone kinase subunit DhaL [Ktedonospora formicarum]GHO50105.1 dihydroxyacetone kinase subunit L [Ktedonospora formicarum]